MREPSTRKPSGGGHPTEAYLTKPDAKAVVRSFGTRIGTDGALPRTPGLDQREYRAMESFQGCKICGCWDLKRVFRVNRIRYALGSWADRRRALRRRRETSVEGHLSVLLALKLLVIGGVRPGRRRPFQNVLCLLPRGRR